MSGIDYYEIVRQKLKLGPLYAPKHKKVFELMKIFWNNDEIQLLSHFDSCDKLNTLKQLSVRTGMSRQEIKDILRNMLRKRTISRIGTRYCLLPLLPGVFEQYFIRRQDSEENLIKAAEIYRFLFKNFLPEFFLASDFKLFRPRLPFEARERLIEIDKTIDIQQQTLSYELVEEIINKYEHFITVPCQCRLIGEYTGEKCDKAPRELGCFIAGNLAENAIKRGATGMNKEEAIEFLKKTEKAGLVHNCVADSSVESTLFMCNCCSCHCGALIGAKEHKTVATIPSNYKPKFYHDICTKCDTCLKKCPMAAIYHKWPNREDKSDEKMYVREEYCIGCGVCAVNCPNNALKMIKVQDAIPKEKHKIGNRTFLEILM